MLAPTQKSKKLVPHKALGLGLLGWQCLQRASDDEAEVVWTACKDPADCSLTTASRPMKAAPG